MARSRTRKHESGKRIHVRVVNPPEDTARLLPTEPIRNSVNAILFLALILFCGLWTWLYSDWFAAFSGTVGLTVLLGAVPTLRSFMTSDHNDKWSGWIDTLLFKSRLATLLYPVLLAIVLTALVGYVVVVRWVIRRLTGLSRSTERVAQGDMSVAIDPGFGAAVTVASLSDVNSRITLINLGYENRLEAADVSPEGNDLVTRLGASEYLEIGPANHFTFLAVCKPQAAEMLAEEGEDPICTDPEEADRKDIHDRLVVAIADALGL